MKAVWHDCHHCAARGCEVCEERGGWWEQPDPLLGPCARCGKVYAEHPGGFCPDQVDASGMVEVGNAAEFQPRAQERMKAAG